MEIAWWLFITWSQRKSNKRLWCYFIERICSTLWWKHERRLVFKNSFFEARLSTRLPRTDICPSVHLRPLIKNYCSPPFESVHEANGPSLKIRPLVQLKLIILVQRPNPSMSCTVGGFILARCPLGCVDDLIVRGWPVLRKSVIWKLL